MANKAEMLIEELEPLAAEHELELVTVEIAGTRKNPVLRVYMDTLAGGITLDQLAEAEEWVDAKIEELDPFEDAYTLEVSSPGIDRPLRKRGDDDRFAGEEATLTLKHGKAHGTLKGIEGDEVVLTSDDGEETRVAFDDIKKANIIGRIDFSGRGLGNSADSTTE